jgi:hypothetical protein
MSVTPDIDQLRRHARALHGHAGGCRKPINECYSCRQNIAWFAALPAAVLSVVLEERPWEK